MLILDAANEDLVLVLKDLLSAIKAADGAAKVELSARAYAIAKSVTNLDLIRDAGILTRVDTARLSGIDEAGAYLKASLASAKSEFGGKSFVNRATGKSIAVTNKGLKHALSGGAGRLNANAMLGLGEILEGATILYSKPPRAYDKGAVTVHVFGAHIEIDGVSELLAVIVKEFPWGLSYYHHERLQDHAKQIQKTPASISDADRKSGSTGRPVAGADPIVDAINENINRRSLMLTQKTKSPAKAGDSGTALDGTSGATTSATMEALGHRPRSKGSLNLYADAQSVKSLLDAVAPIERIQLTGKLASKLAALGKLVPPLERVKLARDVAAILKELGAAAAELVFDLADPEATKASLSDYLSGGINALPEALRACEAATIAELAKQIGASELMWQAQRLAGELRNTFGPAFAEMSGRGLAVDIDSDALKGKLDEALAVSKQLVTDDPEWQAAQATLRQLNTSIRDATRSIDAQLRTANQAWRSANENGQADVAAVAESLMADLADKRRQAVAEYGKAFGAAEKAADARAKRFKSDRAEKANAIVRAEGEAVVEAIKAKSPVSAEQAMAWAQAQKVDDSAFKRMAKNGYPKAQVLQDLADFYQISGGKASAISLVNTGGKRAYASNINTSDREKIISIDTSFNRTVLFHELAHHLENDPIAKAAANGYIEKRRESTKLYSLRSLTGNRGFGPREAAYKDDFLDAYMGKVYPDKSTEVFSMAVQYLANPLDAARMYAKDPELFAMVSGYLGSDLTPAMKARLGLHAGKIEEKADLEQQAVSAIAEAASGVLLTASRWFEDFRAADDWKARYAVGRAGGDGEKMKTVGAYPQLGLYVIEGPVRTGGRGRRSKGFMVLRDTGAYPDAVFAGRSLEEAKAMVAAAIKLNGNLIAAKTTYFGQGATPEAIAALKQLSQKGA